MEWKEEYAYKFKRKNETEKKQQIKITKEKKMKTRYTNKYKFITGQPNDKGEYYVYRFEKLNKEFYEVIVYKMKGTILKEIYKTKTSRLENNYKDFLTLQEYIEGRKFFEKNSEYYNKN